MPSPKFSEELIARGQEYFEKRCEVKASKGEMELWLDSLADFYAFFENRAVKTTTQEKVREELAIN